MYILSKKIKHYTKETIKLTSIILLGILIIIAVTLLKMKPVYGISIDGEIIGYINDKNGFEKTIYETFNDNEENNIAFADLKVDTQYEFKLIERNVKTCEEEAIATLAKNADITYFQYAIVANGEEIENFLSEEQANEVLEKIKGKVENDVELSVSRVYKKQIEAKENTEIDSLCETTVAKIKEQKRKERATINGVYIAVVPVRGNITSRFGSREAIRDHSHKGLDIAAKTGTPIKAAADGKIKYADTMSGYGNLIIIDHGNGITTYYGHCSKLYKKEGQKVKAGDVIAAVGNTGNSTGSHLHFEIRKNGVYVNPANYLY